MQCTLAQENIVNNNTLSTTMQYTKKEYIRTYHQYPLNATTNATPKEIKSITIHY